MEEFKVPNVNSKSLNKMNKQELAKLEPEVLKNNTNITSEQNSTEIPYKEPIWSGKPDENFIYKFEVLKSGAILEEIENLQSKPFWLFGRLPEHNDIVMAHPTISRFHAVLQYRSKAENPDDSNDDDDNTTKSSMQNNEKKFEQGWYIFDLGSTHGTFLNKMRIPSKTYFRVRVGHMLKLGNSSRNYILQGPEFDEEPESELSVTELKELRVKQEKEKAEQIKMQEIMREKEGIDWGMGEDADEETDLTVNPYATTNNEELFLDDPKKTLRGFFEREGLELEYKADEMSAGTFICRVELPIFDAHGKPIVAEVCHKGKKKECVVQCALEACRILDRHGVLRQSHHEPLKRKKAKNDSDEDDDFLDRTGDIERKRLRKISAANQNTALTYEDLLKQENDLLERLATIEENILHYQEISKRSKESTGDHEEDLDDYMKNLTSETVMDKSEIRKLKVEEQKLKSEHQKIQKLLEIAKPVQLPPLGNQSATDTTKKKLSLPLFGKRNKIKMNIVRSEVKTKSVEKELMSDEEEIEEDDVKEKKNNPKHSSETESSKDASVKHTECNFRDAERQGSSSYSTEIPKRKIGASIIPEEFKKILQEESISTNKERNDEKSNTCVEEKLSTKTQEHENETVSEAQNKRRRIRNRIRGRDNVDVDNSAETEDNEKYSGWLPPEDQAGDGMTSLNEKFGY